LNVPPSDPPALIVVTGPPASGKSSTSRRLAERLRVPFVSKDTFKERLYEHFGSADEVQETVEEAALAILFSVVDGQLAAGVSVVAESDFNVDSNPARLRELAEQHGARVVQVYIGGDVDALVAKFAQRAACGDRHPGHRDEPEDAAELREKLEARYWPPLDLPGRLVRADMSDDEDVIVDRVGAVLGGPRS
jgi:predicted kinase